MSMSAHKVFSADTNGFTETEEYQLLHCGNVDGNNNKFFCIELQKNPQTNEYRIFTEYGRINAGVLRDVRGPVTDRSTVKKQYDKIIKSKTKGKKKVAKDGSSYIEKYVPLDMVGATIGSPNIRQSGTVKTGKAQTSFQDTFQNSGYDVDVKSLLTQLLEENIHNITSISSITVSSNGLETPLGPVTASHIQKARDVLDQLKNHGTLKYADRTVRDLNTHYYSMIPHPFGRKITESDCILDDSKLIQEYDLLDQMESALQVADVKDSDTQHDLGLNMVMCEDQDVKEQLTKQFMDTRHPQHQHLWKYKIKNIYEVENVTERERFRAAEAKYSGPQYHLFHGSRNANILSILLNGFYIPPVSAPHVTGRMFGNGVYGASASTKSLNYSTGYWGGPSSKHNNAFLFVTCFSMGNVYECQSSVPGGAPYGYDSIHAKAGRSLLNDEFIVYNLDQTTVTHLIELEV